MFRYVDLSVCPFYSSNIEKYVKLGLGLVTGGEDRQASVKMFTYINISSKNFCFSSVQNNLFMRNEYKRWLAKNKTLEKAAHFAPHQKQVYHLPLREVYKNLFLNLTSHFLFSLQLEYRVGSD